MRRIFNCYCTVLIVVCSILVSGCNKTEEAAFQEISFEEVDEEGTSEGEEMNEAAETIFVHVCGEVNHPGVYELDAESRVYKALEAAGGMTKAAAEEALNQAEILSDGQQLYVPSEAECMKQSAQTGTSDDGKININKASKEELMTLSGIGESKADAIIRYREENGNFKSIEEIMEIEGIKEGVFHKIEEGITAS